MLLTLHYCHQEDLDRLCGAHIEQCEKYAAVR